MARRGWSKGPGGLPKIGLGQATSFFAAGSYYKGMIDRYSRRLSSALLPALLLIAGLPHIAHSAAALQLTGRRLNFDDGWRFLKGEAQGAERPEFQDSSWTPTQLPHDWAIEEALAGRAGG